MPVQIQLSGPQRTPVSLAMGCLPMFLFLILMCLLPVFLYDTARAILTKLGLSPQGAGLTVLAIFFGSLINIPVHQIVRDELQPDVRFGPIGRYFERDYRRVYSRTLIAVNVGGCVIPVLLAVQQMLRVAQFGDNAIFGTLIVSALSIGVCYLIARPVQGIGIMMPGLIPPLVCVLSAWILMPSAPPEQRTAAAFIGGVLGPLIGADLLHLKDIAKTPVGIMSIGGAGTFDGIILSGMLAALLS